MSSSQIPYVIAFNPSVQPLEYELSEDVCTIGRHETCQIVVESTQKIVSRLHAKIERSGPRYLLSDAGSANGTFVNSQRLQGIHVLINDDLIGLGSKSPLLRFIDPDKTIVTNIGEWLHYDEGAMRFSLQGKPVDLSASQLRLLLHLYRHAGEVCTREQCTAIIYGPNYSPDQYAILDETMNKLRKKLCQAAPDQDKETLEAIRKKLISTRYGLGYVLYLHPDDADEQN